MNEGIIIASQIESLSTRVDGSIKIVLGCQEISPSKMAELFTLKSKLVAVYISPKDTISQKEMTQVDAIEVEFGGKTSSQRMRNVYYLLWNQDNEGFKTFDNYYQEKMNEATNILKAKII